jgi:uncharacterized protein (TIGR02598 family)
MNTDLNSLRIFQSHRRRQAGFSLVEVVLAVGVVSFAFVAILGLIPAGLSQFRQAVDTSVCSQIAQRVIMDAQQTEFDILIDAANTQSKEPGISFRAPKISGAELRYFDEQGNEVVPSNESAKTNPATLSTKEKALIVYHVNTRIRPMTVLPRTSGDESPAIATVTVEVAYNPGHRKLSFKANISNPTSKDYAFSNLIDLSDPTKNPGVTVKTYASQVGRNQ